MNVIAKKAGVSIGVLYKYYEDKNSFFLACVRHALESLDEVLTARIDAGRDPEENAETLIRAAVEFSREHPETVILYHRITCFEDGEFAEQLVREIEGKTAETYRTIISAYQDEGKVRKEIDAGYLAMLFDDILMMVQFTIACQYYRHRHLLYAGKGPEKNEEELIASALAFVRQAFSVG